MRVIEAFDKPIRTVAFSPDGRFIAAGTEDELVVFSQITGEKTCSMFSISQGGQLAFGAKNEALVYTGHKLGIAVANPWSALGGGVQSLSRGPFSGGVAVSPDGKTLVATREGRQQHVKLDRWSIPGWRPLTGFDFWSPFQRLAFSPNGEFLAGINIESFELRIAVTGGLNGRQRPRDTTSTAFLTFPRHGETVVFGWDEEYYVMETRAGNVLKRIAAPGKSFVDAAFTGNGSLLATVDGTAVMSLWSADSWEVIRGYDWRTGGLTCIAVAADGLTGVCGTTNGRLIAFDVDE